jgi:SEC-C motif-containing protein
MKWLGLEVKHAKNTGPNTAIVEFIARYKIAGKAERLHEISEFVLENNLWYYVDARP